MTNIDLLRIVGPIGIFLLLLLPALLYVWLKFGPRKVRDLYHGENQRALGDIDGSLRSLTMELGLHNGRLKVLEERVAGHELLDIERERHGRDLLTRIEQTMRDLHAGTS